MSCMQKRLTISVDDFRHLSIHCVHCGSVVTMDLAEPKDKFSFPQFVPSKCPLCNRAYDCQMAPAIQGFIESLRILQRYYADRVSFSGTPEDVNPCLSN
jgi:hypothetical protein